MNLQSVDLSDARVRGRIYTAVAILLFLLSVALAALSAALHHDSINWIMSDGRRYWVYLPSAVIDHDLDLANQIREHFPARLHADMFSNRTPRGYVANKYPAGEALTLAPAFLVAHALARLLHPLTGWVWLMPDGYSLIYQVLCVAWVAALGGASMILMDRWLARMLPGPPGGLLAGVLLLWVGTQYFWYFVFEPFMVHVVSAFWIVCVVYFSGRAVHLARRERASPWLPGAIGFAAAMAFVCRPTNVFILPVAALGFWQWLRAAEARLWWRALPGLVVAPAPILIQMSIWRITSGSYFYYSYTRERFDFAHPALWQTLVSTWHGLFLWSPLLLLAVWGLARHGSRWPQAYRPVLAALVIGGLILWYLNSSWWCWWFGWAFGARAFIELAPLFLAGLVLALQADGRPTFRSRRRLAISVAALLCFHFTLVALVALKIVPMDPAPEPAASAFPGKGGYNTASRRFPNLALLTFIER